MSDCTLWAESPVSPTTSFLVYIFPFQPWFSFWVWVLLSLICSKMYWELVLGMEICLWLSSSHICSCLLIYSILWQKTWWLLNKNRSLVLTSTVPWVHVPEPLKWGLLCHKHDREASSSLVWAQDFPLLWCVVSGAPGKDCLGPTPRF